MVLNWIDITLIVIAVVSTLFGLFRGFFREIASLVILIIAFFVSRYVGSTYLLSYVSGPSQSILLALGYLCVFLLVLILGYLIMMLINRVIEKTPFSFLNALLGGVFGFLRGVVIVLAILFFAGFTSFSQQDAWKQSYLVQASESSFVKSLVNSPVLQKKLKKPADKEELTS